MNTLDQRHRLVDKQGRKTYLFLNIELPQLKTPWASKTFSRISLGSQDSKSSFMFDLRGLFLPAVPLPKLCQVTSATGAAQRAPRAPRTPGPWCLCHTTVWALWEWECQGAAFQVLPGALEAPTRDRFGHVLQSDQTQAWAAGRLGDLGITQTLPQQLWYPPSHFPWHLKHNKQKVKQMENPSPEIFLKAKTLAHY